MKRKFLTIILMLAMCCAMLFASAVTAGAAEGTQGVSAKLALPATYEQYLELVSPSSFAVSADYTAIADYTSSDNSVIYVYDRAAGRYQAVQNAGKSPKSLCFYEDAEGNTFLYYVINDNSVYRIDLSDYSRELVEGFTCYSLIISGDTVFSARTQGDATIYRSDIADITATEEITTFASCNTPNFALYGGNVYLAINNEVFIYNENQAEFSKTLSDTDNDIVSFAVYSSSSFYYTTSGGSLYQKNGTSEERIMQDERFVSVTYSENSVYLLSSTNNSVKQIRDGALTDYEIGKYSNSVNRLAQGASDLSRYGDRLIIADTENDRVLIRNGTGYEPVSVISPKYICAGENSFLVTDGTNLYLYDYDGTPLRTYPATELQTTFRGCAYSYGKYYLIGTSDYILDETDFSLTQTPAIESSSIAADVRGNLYLLRGNSVYTYTAESFASGESANVSFTAPANTLKILSDYSGNVYALTADEVCLLYETSYSTLFDTEKMEGLLYRQSPASFVSFAFGFEENTVYILSDGFVVAADLGENAPKSLLELDAGTSYSAMHGSASADEPKSLLVKVSAGSVVLSIDGTKLTASSDYLTYTGYARTQTERIGIRIADTAGGTLVAFYEYVPAEDPEAFEGDRLYTLCLVLDEVTAAGGYTADSYSAYATNDVEIFRYPSFLIDSMLLQAGELARGQTVTVLGTISVPVDEETGGFGVDYDYCFVKVGDVYGYVPAAYLVKSANNASASTSEYSFFHVKKGESITLYSANGGSVTLEDEELVRVYGEPDKDNLVRVTYTDDLGATYEGRVDADLLYRADGSVLVVLAVVCLVTAAVLFSGCYLILRRQPTVV